jgi:2-polyprenyl-6-methoxyphenol hydroxylase-like FAD-dependent oxidoreductase
LQDFAIASKTNMLSQWAVPSPAYPVIASNTADCWEQSDAEVLPIHGHGWNASLRPSGWIMSTTTQDARAVGSRLTTDVAIVGGGPVGCVAALAFAQRGARVSVIDAGSAPTRLAGEWLHPTGVSVLTRLGVDLTKLAIPHSRGRGFAIFPHTGSPIVLSYVNGELGIGCQHHVLVETLQRQIAQIPNIRLMQGYRVVDVQPGTVVATCSRRSRTIEIRSGLVVGADGRQSIVRQRLGYSSSCQPVSYMAGFLIAADVLPYPDHGNVFLGGPGPVLAFCVSNTLARVCFDVPANRVAWIRQPRELLMAYRAVLPEAVFDACRKVAENEAPAVAANQLLRRRFYGRAGMALIGDAVGHCHPLCAVGMSVGFLDAVALAESATVEEFAARRASVGRVPELLSMGLYDLFVSPDPGSAELRAAVYQLWRTSAPARRDTMRLLAVRETRRAALAITFARLVSMASRQIAAGLLKRSLGHSLAAVCGLGRWGGWLAREMILP